MARATETSILLNFGCMVQPFLFWERARKSKLRLQLGFCRRCLRMTHQGLELGVEALRDAVLTMRQSGP